MNLDLGPQAEALREEIRPWLAANRFDGLEEFAGQDAVPTHHRGQRRQLLDRWAEQLLEVGLLCPTWPIEFGGRGLGPLELVALHLELADAGMPRVVRGMGENLVGPSLLVHGTQEQKAHFLPRIVQGLDHYCQGFSEPEAGSDLASLRTRGEVQGDEVVITGQKVWTSWHHDATSIFTLCRTDPTEQRHRGLSYVLVARDQPGVEVRPIRQMTGSEDFAEVFFTGARASMFDVIGGLGNGWAVAMTTLGNERSARAATHHLPYEAEFWRLVEVARRNGRVRDPRVRDELGWAYAQIQVMKAMGLRSLASSVAGEPPGPEAALTKLVWSEYHRRFGEIALSIRGTDSLVRPSDPAAEPLGVHEGRDHRLDEWQQVFLSSRGGTIYAGTSEVQRNIIGERILGLPR